MEQDLEIAAAARATAERAAVAARSDCEELTKRLQSANLKAAHADDASLEKQKEAAALRDANYAGYWANVMSERKASDLQQQVGLCACLLFILWRSLICVQSMRCSVVCYLSLKFVLLNLLITAA